MKHILLIGPAGAGKSSIAAVLEAKNGFKPIKFAYRLKKMLLAMGLTQEDLEDPDLKNTPHPLLRGKTPRHAMQTLGTDWGRDLIHHDLWAENTLDYVYKLARPVVADDVRFENEIELSNRYFPGTVTIAVLPTFKGYDKIQESNHPSESWQKLHHDYVVRNEDIGQAAEEVIKMRNMHIAPRW